METMGGYLNVKFIHFVLIETIRIDHRAVGDWDGIVFTLDFAVRLP